MDTLLQDVRYGLRTLARNPGFAALTIICLAVGIGVNSMMYSVVDSIVRPLPFADPETLVAVHEAQPSNGIEFGGVSYEDLQDFRAQSRALSDLAAYTGRSLTFADTAEPERVNGTTTSWNLITMLGTHPLIGRQFTPDDDRPGAPGVVLLSYGLWQRRYAGDPSIVGRSITVNGAPTTVIGVMPPRFEFPEKIEGWIPLAPLYHTSSRGSRALAAIGRLAPDRTLDQARQELSGIAARVAAEHQENTGWTTAVRSIDDELISKETRLIIFTMMGAVSLVLLIACSNVANLLLARASVRHREMAVRAALGAGQGRIVRQLLTESILIALASMPLGVLLAHLGLKWLDRAIPPQEAVPYYIDWSLNRRVLLYTLSVSLVTGVLFGLAPSLHALRTSLQDSLKDRSGPGGSRNRLRGSLVVAEIALSLVLLVGASLFVRSFLNLERTTAGFDTHPLLTMRFYMPGEVYDDGAMKRRVEDIVRRVESLPGVVAATASNLVPLGSGGDEARAIPDGVSFAPGEAPNIFLYGVTPHFFPTLNVAMSAGRDFTDADGAGKTGVAIVNQLMAKRLWPKTPNVVGERFRIVNEANDERLTVIGVVPDIKIDGIRERRPVPRAFVSYAYSPARNTGLTIRATGAASAITQDVRQQIHHSDPALPVFNEQSMDELRALSYWQYRLFGWMFSIFGSIALLLASVGVYGVLAYAVSQRTQEIGVRMALGASRGDVFTLIVSQGAKLAAAGIALGALGALGITRVVKSLLYDVSATDPLSFAVTGLSLIAVALVASYVPARRATGVDPMIALRAE
jgi:putative ABC transport system permease protein